MSPVQVVILVSILVLVLWVAYRIGKVLLRILAGLAFLGLVGYAIWYLFRHRPTFVPRSQHGSHLLFAVRR